MSTSKAAPTKASNTSRRIPVLLLLLLVFLVGSVALYRSWTPAPRPGASSVAPSDTTLSATRPAGEGQGISEASRPESIRASALAHTGPISLRGQVRVLDRDGLHRRSHRGFIRWRISHPLEGESSATSAIVQDRWTLSAAPQAILEPIEIMWSGEGISHKAVPFQVALLASEADGHTVEAHLDYGFVMNVIDAETRVHLADAQLVLAVACDSWPGDTQYPPDIFREGGMTLGGESPFVLPHLPGTRVGWARAPGYRWRRFAFSGNQGELTLPLHRGADVLVRVSGLPQRFTNARLLVFSLSNGDERAERFALAETGIPPGGSVSFVGLPAGPTEFVVVPFPQLTSAAERLGEIDVELVAGSRRELLLDLSSPEATKHYGAIEVVVRRADSLGSRMARVELHRTGSKDLPPVEHYIDARELLPDGTYEFRREHVKPGDYVIALLPVAASAAVAVQAGETSRVELDAGNTIGVTASVIDPETTARLGGDIVVAYRPAQVHHATTWREVQAGRGDKAFSFRCAPGVLSLAAWGPGRETVVFEQLLQVDGEELSIPLARVRRLPIRLRARQHGTDVPLPAPFWTNLSVTPSSANAGRGVEIELGTRQVAALRALDTSQAIIHVSAPGRYRIDFTALLGISAPSPLEVEVLDDASPEHLVEVTFD